METKIKIDVEALKKSLLQRRPMKARFKLPMTEEQAYAYLLAAVKAEVAYRHRSFCSNEDVEKQLQTDLLQVLQTEDSSNTFFYLQTILS